VDPTLNGYHTEHAKQFYKQLTHDRRMILPRFRVFNRPLSVVPPLTYSQWSSTITVEGYPAKPGEDMNSWMNHVSPGFFAALRIPLYSGRNLPSRIRAPTRWRS
jgi:hypothetical protein